MNIFLFGVLPYIAMGVFVVGLIWRYRYDKFGWTTRSSQLYEAKLLRIGGPMFHFGIIMAVAGHAMGLLIPKSWTEAIGLSEHVYHMIAVAGGLTAGFLVTVGFLILLFRRRMVKTVFNATTVSDKVMYAVLAVVVAAGMWNTISTATGWGLPTDFTYRENVSIWFRSLFTFQPNVDAMGMAPLQFQLHAVLACVLMLIFPFTRLVHMRSVPVKYIVRPYIVYRTPGDRPGAAQGSRAPRGTWKSPTAAKK